MATLVIKSAKAELTVDIVTARGIEYSNEVTEYPVEEGYKISDAVIKGAPKLSFDCVVTNAAMGADDVELDLLTQVITILADPVGYTVDIDGTVYDELAIESSKVSQSASEHVELTLGLTKIRKVASQKAIAPPKPAAPGAKGKTGQSKKKTGANDSKPVEQPERVSDLERAARKVTGSP